MKHSANRVLVWALGLSLLAHAIVAVVARVPRAEAAPEQRPSPTSIVHVVVPPPTPTPKPQPPQRPSHPAAPVHGAPRVHVAAPHVADHGAPPAPGPQVVATTGADVPGIPDATAPPASPRPACSVPNAPAHTIAAAMPDTPDGVAGLPATAEVQVTLDAAGRVTDVRIYRSADDPQLDRAALAAARSSTYAPATVDCLPAGGTYLFRVEFQG